MDYIVKDSSIYQGSNSYALERRSDATLKIGVVRDTVDIAGDDIAYIVEVWIGGKYAAIQCTRPSRFGGAYNYEEYTYRGFEPTRDASSDGKFDFKKGDCVLVAYLLGSSLDGIIVSSFNHPSRPRLFKPEDGIVYQSEFNGLNKSITKDGEYTVTFKGLQTNINELDTPSDGTPIPAPEYDEDIGSSYYKFDKTGSFTVSDNATQDPQTIFVDKENGQVVITSGKTTLTIDKEAESYEIINKKTTFTSEDEWNLGTKLTNISSTQEINLETAKFKTTGDWEESGNKEIKGNINQIGNLNIDGNLTSSGVTKLAGGDHSLIYDIILTIGTGNLGAPVVSNNIVLKTVLTKAT